jgi:hypothetical protein
VLGLGKKGLSAAVAAQIRLMIREEVREEIHLQVSPAFLDAVTTGRDKMERIFDGVRLFQEELDELKLSVEILVKSQAR